MHVNEEHVLSLIAPFYAELYDRAHDTINAFARTEAGQETFNPDAEKWDEFVQQIALHQVFTSTFSFATHEDEPSPMLKYLLDDNGALYTELDDRLERLSYWMTQVDDPRCFILPHVARPLPPEMDLDHSTRDDTTVLVPLEEQVNTAGGLLRAVVPVLGVIYGNIYLNVLELAPKHRTTGAIKPIGPGWEHTKRCLALELTKLTPRLFREHEHDPVSLKYYIDIDGEMIRNIDDLLGNIEEHIDQPGSILEGATSRPLPDPARPAAS